MNLFFVEFNELYARHLCRHSQFGINVIHLLAPLGTWYAVMAFCTGWSAQDGNGCWRFPPGLPGRARRQRAVSRLVGMCRFLGLILAGVIFLPVQGYWVLAYVVLIPVLYKVQSWSHKIYTMETDMTEFNKKYSKGSVLFVVLLIYEVPIVMNFLLFDVREHATANQDSEPVKAS